VGFKDKVALATVECEKMLVELSFQFDAHQNLMVEWKWRLLDRVPDA